MRTASDANREGSDEGEVMADIDDGGPAFPVPSPCFDHVEHGELTGMSLRDWFAVHALLHCLQTVDVSQPWKLPACIAAYEIADAMLAARKGNQP